MAVKKKIGRQKREASKRKASVKGPKRAAYFAFREDVLYRVADLNCHLLNLKDGEVWVIERETALVALLLEDSNSVTQVIKNFSDGCDLPSPMARKLVLEIIQDLVAANILKEVKSPRETSNKHKALSYKFNSKRPFFTKPVRVKSYDILVGAGGSGGSAGSSCCGT